MTTPVVRVERTVPPGWLLALIPYGAVLIGLTLCGRAWLAIGIYHAGMLLAIPPRTWQGVTKGWTRGHGVSLSAFCALSGPALGIAYWIGVPIGVSTREALAAFGLSGSSFHAFVAYYVLVNPVLEEVFWRGRLLRAARGITHVDVLFAGYHVVVLAHFMSLPASALALVVLTGVAWLWRRSVRRTGGLAISVVSHAIGDASVMAAVVWLCGVSR